MMCSKIITQRTEWEQFKPRSEEYILDVVSVTVTSLYTDLNVPKRKGITGLALQTLPPSYQHNLELDSLLSQPMLNFTSTPIKLNKTNAQYLRRRSSWLTSNWAYVSSDNIQCLTVCWRKFHCKKTTTLTRVQVLSRKTSTFEE